MTEGMAKIHGQRECFICHQQYRGESDRRLIQRSENEYVYLNVACYEKVRELAVKNRVSINQGLEIFSTQLATALLGYRA